MSNAVDVVREAATAESDLPWQALAPSEDVLEMAAAAQKQLVAEWPLSAVRRVHDGGAAIHGWEDLAAQGYLSIGIPEELGGLGTLVDLTTVLEVAGGSLVPLPLVSTAAAMQVLVAAGIATEDADPRPIGLAVGRADTGESAVFDGRHAEEVVHVEAADQSIIVSRLLVSGAARRVETNPIDPARATAHIDLTALEVLARVELSGWTLADILAPARIVVAADLLGTGDAAHRAALAHVGRREQFGRLIGSFQAVKHQLVDAYVAMERARSLTIGAAVRVQAGPAASARRLSRLAKAAATDAAVRAAHLDIQLLGAMGLTFEADAHLYLRRALQTAPFLGSPGELYADVAADHAGRETDR